ncbi:MAG: hypothetical protein ACI8W3_002844, partial [Myxococcota bacterium]
MIAQHLIRGAEGREFALGEDCHSGGECAGLGEIVCAKHKGFTFTECCETFLDLGSLYRVEAACRFVGDQQLGLVKEGLC